MKNLNKLTLSAMFFALGLILPFFTGQIPEIGNMLLPMHIPVLLCGLICSCKHGLALGFILPLFRSFLFSRPPLYPNAVSMAFELAAYGFIIGIIYANAKKQNLLWLYISLISAMIGGRIVWGIVRTILYGINVPFSFTMFISAGFIEALPGIILQLILIPSIMLIFKKTKIKI